MCSGKPGNQLRLAITSWLPPLAVSSMGDRSHRSPQPNRPPRRGRSRSRSRSPIRDRDRPPRFNKDDRVSRRYSYSRSPSRSRTLSRSPVRKRRSRSRDRSNGRSDRHDRPDTGRGSKRPPSPPTKVWVQIPRQETQTKILLEVALTLAFRISRQGKTEAQKVAICFELW